MNLAAGMKSRICILLLCASPLVQAALPEERDCAAWTRNILENKGDYCDDLCPQASRFDGYDYAGGLREAFRSREGLSRLFVYTERSSIIGAGGDAQACTLHALLLHWGDTRFAKALAVQPADVRADVMGLLDYAAVPRFSKRFPKTYALASHDD
jgi:hypothetical protein